MSDIFLKIVNMSISASWLVLAVLILRLLLKKAPKWVNVLLWGIVAARLMLRHYLQTRGPAYYAYSTIYSIGFGLADDGKDTEGGKI